MGTSSTRRVVRLPFFWLSFFGLFAEIIIPFKMVAPASSDSLVESDSAGKMIKVPNRHAANFTLIGFFSGYGPVATVLGSICVVGLIVLPFLPQTKGQPLPA
jgi:hypothetical protein